MDLFFKNFIKIINDVIGNVFQNAQGDVLDIFNPVKIVTSIGIEFILFALLIISFPILCIGISGIAKRSGLKFTFLAFVPGLHVFYAGKIAKEINLFSKRIKNPQWLLLSLFLLNYTPILDLIPGLGTVLEVIVDKVYYVLLMVTIHRIYEIHAPKKADSMIIISIPFQFLNSVFMYRLRKASPVNSKIILDYDFDGIYDEDVEVYIKDNVSDSEKMEIETEHVIALGATCEDDIHERDKVANVESLKNKTIPESKTKATASKIKRISINTKRKHICDCGTIISKGNQFCEECGSEVSIN